MKIECPCGTWHDVSPTGLVVILTAFVDGDMQRIEKGELKPICFGEAFKSEERIRKIHNRYRASRIEFDYTIQTKNKRRDE